MFGDIVQTFLQNPEDDRPQGAGHFMLFDLDPLAYANF
jgi:hypothetical protein